MKKSVKTCIKIGTIFGCIGIPLLIFAIFFMIWSFSWLGLKLILTGIYSMCLSRFYYYLAKELESDDKCQ